MIQSLGQPLLTEAEYRAAVDSGQVAPCDSVMQLASADYAKGWADCRERMMRYVNELLSPREDARRLPAAALRTRSPRPRPAR